MLKYLPAVLLLLPSFTSAQDHCPCRDRENSEPEMDMFMSSLDNSLSLTTSFDLPRAAVPLKPTPIQQWAEPEPVFHPEPDISEPEEAEDDFYEPSEGVASNRRSNRKARRPSRRGMKSRKKVKRYRGQCPVF